MKLVNSLSKIALLVPCLIGLISLSMLTHFALNVPCSYDESIVLLETSGYPGWPEGLLAYTDIITRMTDTTSVTQILKILKETDVHPPTFYLVTHALKLVGFNSYRELRLISILLSALALCLYWRLLQTLPLQQTDQYLAFATIAFSPYMMKLGWIVKGYSLAMLLSVFSYLILYKTVINQKKTILLCLSTSFCALSHFFSFVPMVAALITRSIICKTDRSNILKKTMSALCVTTSCYMLIMFPQRLLSGAEKQFLRDPSSFFEQFFKVALAQISISMPGNSHHLLVAFFLFCLAFHLLSGRRPASLRATAGIVLLTMLSFSLLNFLLNREVVGPGNSSRYLSFTIFLVPPLLLGFTGRGTFVLRFIGRGLLFYLIVSSLPSLLRSGYGPFREKLPKLWEPLTNPHYFTETKEKSLVFVSKYHGRGIVGVTASELKIEADFFILSKRIDACPVSPQFDSYTNFYVIKAEDPSTKSCISGLRQEKKLSLAMENQIMVVYRKFENRPTNFELKASRGHELEH